MINALYNKGEHGFSLKELNDRWIRDINVSNGEPLHRQTFDRWKGNILMAFGVNIECNLKGGYRYYISNPESLNNGEISITHKNFTHKKSYTFPVEPYCLKMFQKRWYLLGKSINDGKMRIYGLDRLENVELTTERFSMPKDFNAKEYFSTFFGIVTDESVAIERIAIRAYKQHQQYVRSLPIHSSQKELYACDAYADFELKLRPTYDFIMKLLHAGTMIEVMEPESLRKTMKEWAKKTMGDIQKGLTTIIRLRNWMWYQLVQKMYRLVLEGIADNTLVALALMIAESRTEEKDVMVKVVVNLINSNNKKRI